MLHNKERTYIFLGAPMAVVPVAPHRFSASLSTNQAWCATVLSKP